MNVNFKPLQLVILSLIGIFLPDVVTSFMDSLSMRKTII